MYLKKVLKYTKPRQDACENCVDFKNVIAKASADDKQQLQILLGRHIVKGDIRYKTYVKDKKWVAGELQLQNVVEEDDSSELTLQTKDLIVEQEILEPSVEIGEQEFVSFVPNESQKLAAQFLDSVGTDDLIDLVISEESELHCSNSTINTSLNDGIEYEVEQILAESINDLGKICYEVKWKGVRETTVEPWYNFDHCKEKLQDFFVQSPPVIFIKDMQQQLPLPTLQPQPSNYYRLRKLHIHNYGSMIVKKNKCILIFRVNMMLKQLETT
jgi:hypothetical protein